MRFQRFRVECPKCGIRKQLGWLHESERWTCEVCQSPITPAFDVVTKAPGVIGDECDITVEHGICNPDGTPRRYTSKSEMRQAAKALGFTNAVEHIGTPGSDKSPHTTRWI